MARNRAKILDNSTRARQRSLEARHLSAIERADARNCFNGASASYTSFHIEETGTSQSCTCISETPLGSASLSIKSLATTLCWWLKDFISPDLLTKFISPRRGGGNEASCHGRPNFSCAKALEFLRGAFFLADKREYAGAVVLSLLLTAEPLQVISRGLRVINISSRVRRMRVKYCEGKLTIF